MTDGKISPVNLRTTTLGFLIETILERRDSIVDGSICVTNLAGRAGSFLDFRLQNDDPIEIRITTHNNIRTIPSINLYSDKSRSQDFQKRLTRCRVFVVISRYPDVFTPPPDRRDIN